MNKFLVALLCVASISFANAATSGHASAKAGGNTATSEHASSKSNHKLSERIPFWH